MPHIVITRLGEHETGWVVATYCDKCAATTFSYSPYAKKPERGDYFLINGMCEKFEHMMGKEQVNAKKD